MSWFEKLAQSSPDGHWRRIPPGEQGKGPSGEPQVGRTWVRRGGLRPSIKIMPHQADFSAAVEALPKNEAGIIAAHGTGTGKTIGAVTAFEGLRQRGEAHRALVVTPAGLRTNFLEKGVEKATDSRGVIVKHPTDRVGDAPYVIVSYDAFRRDPEKYVETYKPDVLIADEVHRAGNPESENYKALMVARKRVPRFVGLTASVVQNDPADVVPLLNLATGKDLPKKQFRTRYVKRVQLPQRGIFGGKVYGKEIVRQPELKKAIGEHIHYVEDLDASQKPTKVVEDVPVEMSSEQIKMYHMAMKGVDPVVRAKIARGEPVSQSQAMNVFTRLMRARQVSNSMHLVDPKMNPEQAADATPKIKKVLDDAERHIKSTPDGQVIMYTNLVHGGVDVLEAGLKKRGISYGVFAGRGVPGMTEDVRQGAVNDYLAGKKKVIVITGAGAEGLSLGNTTMVQLVDGHYNPERISQAEARGIRAGGLSQRPLEKRKVTVRRYVSSMPKTFWQTITFQEPEKSVDQWVYATAARKAQANRALRDVLQGRSNYEKRRRESPVFRWFGGGP